MDTLVSYIKFYLMYSLLYSLPVFAVLILLALFNISPAAWFEEHESLRIIFLIVIMAFVIALQAYRTKLAVGLEVEQGMSFMEAHQASAGMLKSHLSFLPVIGRFFEEK